MCTWSEKRLPLAKEPMPISALYLQHSDTLGGRGSFRSLPACLQTRQLLLGPKIMTFEKTVDGEQTQRFKLLCTHSAHHACKVCSKFQQLGTNLNKLRSDAHAGRSSMYTEYLCYQAEPSSFFAIVKRSVRQMF